MLPDDASHVLNNAVWYALNSHHAQFASGSALVKRYPAEIGFFVAFEQPSDAVLQDLKQVVAPGEMVDIRGIDPHSDLPGWTVHRGFALLQMVSQQPPVMPESAEQILDLTADDLPEMLDLIKLTAPGPFARRTMELGHYIGIRKDGKLIAMAGERIYVPGYREISAVCTHPDYRGRGYARLLVSALAGRNWAHGDVPFLHVVEDHEGVVRLYESLGFRAHQELWVWLVSY